MSTDNTAARRRTALGLAAVVSSSAIACHRAADAPVTIDEANAAELEIGDVVPTPNAYVLGAVHRSAAGRVAALMSIPRVLEGVPDASGVGPRWLDLTPTLGDAPPPRLVPRAGGSELVAA